MMLSRGAAVQTPTPIHVLFCRAIYQEEERLLSRAIGYFGPRRAFVGRLASLSWGRMECRSVHRRRRAALASGVGLVVLIGAFSSFQSFAFGAGSSGTNGSPQTFSQVNCQAHVGSSVINQKQDITVYVTAPDHVDPGENFAIDIPTTTAELPSSSQGLTINSYKDLKTIYRESGGSVVVGSGTTAGPATINGTDTPAVVDTNSTDIDPGVPGPIPPGELITPDEGATITGGADGTQVTISAVEVDTTANIKNIGDVPVVCTLPPNTLTTTIVGTPPATTVPPSTTVPPGDPNTLQCAIGGTVSFRAAVPATAPNAAKNMTEHVQIKSTLSACTGGPSIVKGPVNRGAFTGNATLKVAAGQARPSCASLSQTSSSIPLKSTTKLQNGTKTVKSLKAVGAVGAIKTSGSNVTMSVSGVVSTAGPYSGKPLSGTLVTNLTPASFNSVCSGSGGLTKVTFSGGSTFYVGTPPPPPAPTTTSTSTTTSTTVAPTTSTTVSTNPVPPEVQMAIITACNTVAAVFTPFGVDLSPLTLGCSAAVSGQGSFLLQLFLANPQLGCTALAGVPVANNPVVATGCVAFATALQPYSSIIAGFVPSTP